MYTHVGINVTNLEASLDFYTKLFGAEPVKVKPDYAVLARGSWAQLYLKFVRRSKREPS